MKRLFCLFAVWISLTAPFSAFAQEQTTSTATTTAPVAEAPATVSDAANRGGLYERAKIESVRTGSREADGGGEQVEIYHVRFLSGPLKGQERDLYNTVSSNPYGIAPKAGNTVVIFMQRGDAEGEWNLYLEGFDRRAALLWLFVAFFLTLILLSGWQGVKVCASIVISVLLIGYVLIPMFLRGVNPVPTAIILTGILTLISTGFATGWNKKSLVTALGTMGGAIIAYGLSALFVEWSHLSGLTSEEDRMFFRDNPGLNPQHLLFAGIIIAAAGAAEDVAVSIASAASEVRRHNPRATWREIFTSAMVVGKDHMGALSNTLILAYVGASLSTLLLFKQFEGSWLKFINFDVVVDQIIRSLTATIGIAFTVPVTALLAAWVALREGGVKGRLK